MSIFDNIPLLPDDPILGLPLIFAKETRTNKVNLGIGAYKTAEGHPLILKCVHEAEQRIWQQNLNKEYPPIDGDKEFNQCAAELILGSDLSSIGPNRIYTSQTIGGSGALRVGGEFYSRLIGRHIFLPQPSWPNHQPLFEKSGLNVGNYPYFDVKTNRLDFQGMCGGIKKLPPSEIILLHASCHNPTGVDPTPEQWQVLSKIIKQRGLFPLFDFAYQGFGSSIDGDAQAVRQFALDGHEMMVTYSFSKNFGLYGERVGLLLIIANEQERTGPIGSQVRALIRGNYSTPPLQGARIVKTILQSKELKQAWKDELKTMCTRLQDMRQTLYKTLILYEIDRDFSTILEQKGLFSFIGLTPSQVDRLREEYAIYMPPNGRINLAGLNHANVEYVAKALIAVMRLACTKSLYTPT